MQDEEGLSPMIWSRQLRPVSRYDLPVLFEKRFHEGLVDGSITLTFRAWSRPQAKAGGRYRTAAGMLEVVSVVKVAVASITDLDAQRAGFESREQLVTYVAKKSRRELGPDAEIYRVQLAYDGPLEDNFKAREADLSDDEVAEIAQRLERLDGRSRHGPWTARTLELIDSNPRVAAARLASQDKREKQAFKTDVRKLKRLGLTLSFKVGYEISPRGHAYMDRVRG